MSYNGYGHFFDVLQKGAMIAKFLVGDVLLTLCEIRKLNYKEAEYQQK